MLSRKIAALDEVRRGGVGQRREGLAPDHPARHGARAPLPQLGSETVAALCATSRPLSPCHAWLIATASRFVMMLQTLSSICASRRSIASTSGFERCTRPLSPQPLLPQVADLSRASQPVSLPKLLRISVTLSERGVVAVAQWCFAPANDRARGRLAPQLSKGQALQRSAHRRDNAAQRGQPLAVAVRTWRLRHGHAHGQHVGVRPAAGAVRPCSLYLRTDSMPLSTEPWVGRMSGPSGRSASCRNDVAGTLGRMQPRCQQYRCDLRAHHLPFAVAERLRVVVLLQHPQPALVEQRGELARVLHQAGPVRTIVARTAGEARPRLQRSYRSILMPWKPNALVASISPSYVPYLWSAHCAAVGGSAAAFVRGGS